MSRIVGDEPCPQCRSRGRDKTGNHLMVFEDGGKHCKRCGYHIHLGSVVEKEEGSHMRRRFTVDEIRNAPAYDGPAIRGIKNSIRAHNGEKVFIDEVTGEPAFIFYPKGPSGYKVRTLAEKGFFGVGSSAGYDKLYRQNLMHSNAVVLCGGEEDANAAQQMLNAALGATAPHCVSSMDGETSLQGVGAQVEWINSHNKVIIAYDMDEVGQKMVDKIVALLDRKSVHVAQMGHKDPNDCLLAGDAKGFVASIANAKVYHPAGIVSVKSLIEQALAVPTYGVPFPWESLNKVTYGMREGEGYYIGAGVKCGKSEWLNQLVKHLASLGQKSFVIKGEEVACKTVRKLGGKMINKVLSNPSATYNEDELRKAMEEMDEYLLLYDRNNSLDWDDVKGAIRHAAIVWGAKFVFVDPITCFTDGVEGTEANRMLQQISRELDQMAKDLGFTYFCFVHLNNPSTGPEHNRGGRVLSSQFTGSRSMVRAGTYILGIERNKDPELSEEEINTSYLVVLDDRENGNTARIALWYDKETGEYLEPEEDDVPF